MLEAAVAALQDIPAPDWLDPGTHRDIRLGTVSVGYGDNPYLFRHSRVPPPSGSSGVQPRTSWRCSYKSV